MSYTGNNASWQGWGWKRGLSHDVVCYKGNGTSGHQITHNMNSVPEMIWVKNRTNTTNWGVYHVGLNGGTTPENYRIFLNEPNQDGADSGYWNDTAPTKTVVTLGNGSAVNQTNYAFVMYLFASIDGVSKCGYYTGTGATGNVITTGFRPRFIIIKRTDGENGLNSSWYQLDTARGINAATGLSGGQDLWLRMNNNASNQADPLMSLQSTGFTLTDTGDFVNGSSMKYIYYAHA
jgi:uncharacterized protein YfaT (DUF1175 family)